jgi:type IV secretion system protein VirB2
MKKSFLFWVTFLSVLVIYSSLALADTGEGLPWEGPLQKIADSLAGPVARAVGIIAVVGVGLTMAMDSAGSLYGKMGKIIFGLSIAFLAGTWGLSFFGFGGGALV